MDTNGLEVIAQIALGLAGFSGVMIALARPSGGFDPVESFRLRALIYASFGAMFLAIIPFAVFGGPWSEATSWRVLGAVMAVYTGAGLLDLPRRAFRLRRVDPEQFPLPLVVIQFGTHVVTFLFALVVLFGLTEYRANAYVMALVLMLLHGAIAFVRVLMYRRS
ncbi:MAG: hypothetical protein FJY54_13090 [Betaproteobacteria bacterium]|nr:hypothetical protein [Betaproteobacteria bacterium]